MAACTVIDLPGLTLGHREDKENELIKRQAGFWRGRAENLERGEKPLAPEEPRKRGVGMGDGLLRQNLQHATQAHCRRRLLPRSRGSQKFEETLGRGTAVTLNGAPLRDPLIAGKLSHAIPRQPGPRPDGSRTHLVGKHPPPDVEAAKISDVPIFRNTHTRPWTVLCVLSLRPPYALVNTRTRLGVADQVIDELIHADSDTHRWLTLTSCTLQAMHISVQAVQESIYEPSHAVFQSRNRTHRNSGVGGVALKRSATDPGARAARLKGSQQSEESPEHGPEVIATSENHRSPAGHIVVALPPQRAASVEITHDCLNLKSRINAPYEALKRQGRPAQRQGARIPTPIEISRIGKPQGKHVAWHLGIKRLTRIQPGVGYLSAGTPDFGLDRLRDVASSREEAHKGAHCLACFGLKTCDGASAWPQRRTG